MSNENAKLKETLAELRRVRDELALKAHLGKAEAKDQWEALEAKWSELESKAAPFGGAAKETAKGVGAALGLAVDELMEGYRRFRDLL